MVKFRLAAAVALLAAVLTGLFAAPAHAGRTGGGSNPWCDFQYQTCILDFSYYECNCQYQACINGGGGIC